MNLFNQQLRKALTTTGDGAALLPYDIEPMLNEELFKLQPLAQLIPVVQARGKTHEFNVRSSHPLGWFEGETTPANAKNSVYQRKSTQLKIQRIWGSVTGFAQTMDEAFADALATELEGSLEGMANVLEYSVMYGCSSDIGFTGDAYQYNGALPFTAKYAPNNIIDAGGNKIALDDLDSAIAAMGDYRQSRNDPKFWVMGMRMRQIVDGLQTRVQMPLTSSELNEGKLVMRNYDGAPIYESDYVVPASSSTSPAVTATLGDNAEGSLAAGTYTYKMSSVTVSGEQVAGTASSGVTADATHLHVHLTWTADANAVLYMIWRQLASGGYFLLDIIPALTYDAAGTVNGVVEAYTDVGTKTPITKMKPLATGEQQIFLFNRNPERGMVFLGKVDDMGRPIDRLFSYVELARVKDTYDYMLKGYLGARIKYPNTAVAVVRHATLA
jgi:hypothetical protein